MSGNQPENPYPPERLAGLKPFEPGQSGNPAGRKKGSLNRTTLIRNILEAKALEILDDDQKNFMGDDFKAETIGEQLTVAMVKKIINGSKGDVQAYKELLDSAFGKLTDKIESKHSFTQMASIQIEQAPKDPTKINAEMPSNKLFEFDVGEKVKPPETKE